MRTRITIFIVLLINITIVKTPSSAQGVITIDHTTQRFIGDISTLDRNKYTNAHILIKDKDEEFEAFKVEYNIAPEYIGGRQFWNPFGVVKNGVIPSVKKKYSGVREVTPGLVATGGSGSLFYDKTVDYSVEDVSEFSKAAAEYVAQSYRDEWALMPQYIEPFNEPMVHANEYYPEGKEGKYVRSKTDKVVTKICEYHRDLGQAIHAIPELANLKVIGYASAYPEFENNDFDIWHARYKQFIDVAGTDMDALSLHLYDGSGVNNSGGRRSGSNSEAILDIIEAYSFIKFQSIKPIAITEYGRLVPNQDGWKAGNGVSNYEAVENAQAPRSQIHLMMNFMERADILELAIPFNVNTRNTNSQYSKSSIWINNNGTVELSQRRYMYEILKDLKGERVRIISSNIDIQTQAFVNDKQLYVVLNNLNDQTQTIDLNLLNQAGLQSVDVKSLKIFINKIPELKLTTQNEAPKIMSLEYGETVVLTYNFDAPISFENKIQSRKYYATEYLKPINANANNTFTINNVEVGNGEAKIRIGVARDHGKTLTPTVLINGTKIDVAGDIIRGYDQNTRKQFFGTLEIPVKMSVLKAGTNKVEVRFSDTGGRISSAILQVEKADKPIQNALSINSTINNTKLYLHPNLVNSGDVATINSTTSKFNLSVYNLQGCKVLSNRGNTINTSGFKPGIYIVAAQSNNVIGNAKLIVK